MGAGTENYLYLFARAPKTGRPISLPALNTAMHTLYNSGRCLPSMCSRYESIDCTGNGHGVAGGGVGRRKTKQKWQPEAQPGWQRNGANPASLAARARVTPATGTSLTGMTRPNSTNVRKDIATTMQQDMGE